MKSLMLMLLLLSLMGCGKTPEELAKQRVDGIKICDNLKELVEIRKYHLDDIEDETARFILQEDYRVCLEQVDMSKRYFLAGYYGGHDAYKCYNRAYDLYERSEVLRKMHINDDPRDQSEVLRKMMRH